MPDYTGYHTYDDPQYAGPYAPRTGPGGYPQGGYQGPQSGYGSFEYDPITGGSAPQGLPPGLQGKSGFAGMAALALRGSAEAETALRTAYGRSLARRLGGISGAQDELQRSMGYESRSQGYSSSLARRALLERRANAIGAYGDATAENEMALGQDVASLRKGTATELIGIKRDEIGLTFQAYLARKAMKQAQQNAYLSAAGELGGAAIGAIGRGAGGNAIASTGGGIY